jgi:PAS domain S-box-containing protein
LKLVGLSQEQCSSFGWGQALHPDDAERTISAWKQCARTGGTWDIEHRFRGVDGTWHDVLARGVPVRNEQGEIVCWAGINLDSSRRKRAEADIARLNRELRRRLSEPADDLRHGAHRPRDSRGPDLPPDPRQPHRRAPARRPVRR